MRRCEVCETMTTQRWCKTCQRSYDRWSIAEGGSVLDAITWAAKRALRVERKRQRAKVKAEWQRSQRVLTDAQRKARA